MAERAANFLKEWIGDNVHNVPGLDDLHGEVARLRVRFEHDAAEAGIPPDEIEEEAGDIDDALTAAYEAVQDPELGFKDARE